MSPIITLFPDPYKYVIGRYNYKGVEWHCCIPLQSNNVLILNLLEFLASATSIYMTIQQLGKWYHIIFFTYGSSALGCVHNDSFGPVS